jgi:flagellar basal body rod protein FlgG
MPSDITSTAGAIDPRGASQAIAFAMRGLEQRFEIVASNLANAETVGHKKLVGRAESFSAELERALAEEEVAAPALVARDFSQGDLIASDDPADLSLNGPGFFAVESEGQVKYTRTLHVHADADGTLLDERNARVLGDGGPLRLAGPLAEFQFENDGTLRTDGAEAGRLRIVAFVDPQRLEDLPGGYWRAEDRLELTSAQGTQVRQRQRENSNVSALDEMVQLITIQRQYEAAQKAMTVESELNRKLNDGLR